MSITFSNGFSITPNTLTPSVVLSNLLLHYNTFDTSSYNGSGVTITDLSGNSRNGTVTGSPTWTSNYFTFTDDYITTPNLGSVITSANEVHSVELWVYPTNNGVLVQYNGTSTPNSNYHFSAIEIVDGNLEVALWSLSGITSTGNIGAVSFNEWHQIVLTYDGSVCKGYLDGIYKGSVNVSFYSPQDIAGTFYMNFGYRDTTSQGDGTDFNGRFGIMRVYNAALTDTQILSNYNSTLTTLPDIITDGLILRLDASNPSSYPGSGTTWTNLIDSTNYTITNGTFDSGNGGSIVFNGTSTFVSLGTILSGGTNFTKEAWVYATSVTTSRNILSSNSNVFWNNSSTLSGGVGGQYSLVTKTSFPYGIWKHVALTFDDTINTMTLYVDGVEVSKNTNVTQSYIGSQTERIGAHEFNGNPVSLWDGKISNVRIYTTTLTDVEVLQNFNIEKSKYGL